MELSSQRYDCSDESQPPDTEGRGGVLLADDQETNIQENYAVQEPIPTRPISNVKQLLQYINADFSTRAMLQEVVKRYHMLITPYYFSLIRNLNDENDPIRKQCVPSPEELLSDPSEDIDPLGEEKTSATPFLVHRYPDRALLLVTSKCFMYCRHCTRKRLWKTEHKEATLADIKTSLEYVRENKRIREIIVSGGDPLTLNSSKLDCILSMIKEIEHVEVVRIGTRAPVVLPSRVDDGLCDVLRKYDNLWINLQFNHPREITDEVKEACARLQKCGIPLSNQSVLLKGVNDDLDTMKELCHKLQAIRVRPYYIFQCDEVVGSSHFKTPVYKGIEILEGLRGHTSGMCVPTFVVDGPGGKGKIPLAPNYLVSMGPGKVTLRNYRNEVVHYSGPAE